MSKENKQFETRFEEVVTDEGIVNERVIDSVYDLTREELDERQENLKEDVKKSLDFYVDKRGLTGGLFKAYKDIYKKANPKMTDEKIKAEFDKEYDLLKAFTKATMLN